MGGSPPQLLFDLSSLTRPDEDRHRSRGPGGFEVAPVVPDEDDAREVERVLARGAEEETRSRLPAVAAVLRGVIADVDGRDRAARAAHVLEHRAMDPVHDLAGHDPAPDVRLVRDDVDGNALASEDRESLERARQPLEVLAADDALGAVHVQDSVAIEEHRQRAHCAFECKLSRRGRDMRAASSLHEGQGAEAGRDAAREALDQVGGAATLVFAFVSGHDRSELADAISGMREVLEDTPLVGCVGGGVVGTGLEVENEPAVSLVAVSGEGSIGLEPFFVRASGEAARDADALSARIEGKLKGAADRAALVLCADPSRFDSKPFLGRFREKRGKLPVVGGLAASPGEEFPVFGEGEEGPRALSGALVSGSSLRVTTAVAQGVRPLPPAGRVTRVQKNLIFEVDGEPAIERLKTAVAAAPTAQALYCGLGLEGLARPDAQGDWLARNILGIDPKTGAVAVAEVVPPGSTVCFLTRDAEAAREDLARRVGELRQAYPKKPPVFGLYFDCVGRGEGLYGESGVDASIIKEEIGAIPLAGFFGNGELAPFLGTNLVHNYTGVLALFGEV